MEITLKAIYEFDENEEKEVLKVVRENGRRKIQSYDYAVVAVVADKIVGFASIMYHPAINDLKHNAYIRQLEVGKEYKGKGIENELYYYLYRHLGDCKNLIATTNDENLRKLFLENGFIYLEGVANGTDIKTVHRAVNKTFFDAKEESVDAGRCVKR